MSSYETNNPTLDPDTDSPTNPGRQLAQFGAGCFWGVELAFQRLEGVVKLKSVTLRQGDVGTQYRSGIYYYNEEQARLAKESLDEKQKDFKNKIVTEILPAKRFYRAEEYHQQYLEKGGRAGSKQSAAKGCNDPIRCYG